MRLALPLPALWAARLTLGDGWEPRIGVDKVFWGVTESVHLVDIVDQTDLVENPDGEDKLSQPMVYLSLPRDRGMLDFGLSCFRGTSREPSFLPGVDDSGRPVLLPVYRQVDQASVDAQITTGAWLLKLEALYRAGQHDRAGREDRYFASVVGFE